MNVRIIIKKVVILINISKNWTKKQTSVLAIFTLMIIDKKIISKISKLSIISQIWYLISISQELTQLFIYSSSKFYVMNPSFVKKLGFRFLAINIKAQKINNFKLKNFEIITTFFLVKNQEKNS